MTKILKNLGCGFVLTEMGDEVFFGSYALDSVAIDELKEGQWVEFELYEFEMGRAIIAHLHAENSKGIESSRWRMRWGKPKVRQALGKHSMANGIALEETSAVARNLVIRGNQLSRRGQCTAAERLYQRALVLVERNHGTFHPLIAEVLECYADLLAKSNRQKEAAAMKYRAEAVWNAYALRFCRHYEDTQPCSLCGQEQEGSD